MPPRHVRSAVVMVPFVFSLFVAGCGNGATMSSVGTSPVPATCTATTPFESAYALSGDTVSMFTVDSCNGSLTPTSPSTVATGTASTEIRPEDMVADPSGRFAYVANIISNATDSATISMYTINGSTGVLTPTVPTTVPTGFLPQGIAVDPTGKFVYTANSDDNTVSMFVINSATGVLTPALPATVATGWSPLSVTIHPSGKFAYVANQDDDTVSIYSVNPTTGVLSPASPATVPTGFSPFGVTVDPSGRFAYVPNAYDPQNTVSQYSIDPVTGELIPDTPPTVTGLNQPTAIAIDPSGHYAYVVNRADDTIALFEIDQTSGTLTQMGSFTNVGMPFRLTFDPSGEFVYIADEVSGVSVYSLNKGGGLTASGLAETAGGALAVSLVPQH